MIPNTKKNINVLIPDGESFFTLSVLNCLSEYKNIDIHLIYSSKEVNGVRYSNKIKSYTFFNKTNNEFDFINFLKQEIRKRNIDILMPLHFNNIRLVSKYKKEFKLLNIKTLVSSVAALNRVNDKWELSKHLEKNKISSPKTFRKNIDYRNLEYPLLAKPMEGIGGVGIELIKDQNVLEKSIIRLQNKKFIFQEFINGYDIDCSVLSKDGEILAFTIQKGLAYSSKPFTPPSIVEFLESKELYKLIEKLIKSLNWTGVANIDLRYDEVENIFQVIEINPRFWGSVEASSLIGVNFPYLYCLTCLGIPYEIPEYRFEKYANNRALIKILKSKLSFKNEKMEVPKNLTIKNDILDPLPKVIKYLNKLWNKIYDFISIN